MARPVIPRVRVSGAALSGGLIDGIRDQGANVVEPENVVDVAMRDKNRVEVIYTSAQSLLAKIDRGIDENRFSGMFDEPFADSSGIPTYLVSRVASERVKFTIAALVLA